ncbi:MAG: site-2 protease family protein [Actinomycetota bacterium]
MFGASGNLRIGRIRGIPISVNAGLAIMAAVFIASLAGQAFPQLDPDASLTVRIVVASITVFGFLASILAHELGHAALARRHQVGVLGIALSLLGGYAQLDRQAPTPRAEFAIAAAGPAVNVAIGLALGALAFGADRFELLPTLPLGALIWLAGINLVLAVLNLFPAAPLDGGRVLTAALWKRLRDAELARIISGRIGLVLGVVVTVVGIVQFTAGRPEGLITVIVGVFLFTGARGEIGAAAVRRRLARTTVQELMIADPPPINDSLTVAQFQDFAGPGRADVVFPVVRWTAEPIGYATPTAGVPLDGLDRSRSTVLDLMQPTPEVARAWMTEPIDAVLRRLGHPDEVLLVVHEPQAGRVVGTVGHGQVRPLLATPDLWGRDRTETEHRSGPAGLRDRLRTSGAT